MSFINAVISLYDVWSEVDDNKFLKEMDVRSCSLKSTIYKYPQGDIANLIATIDYIFEDLGYRMVKIDGEEPTTSPS